MNFLFISPNSPFESTGGIERHINNLIKYCSRQKKHRYFILLPTKVEKDPSEIGNLKIVFSKSLSISLVNTLTDKEKYKKAQEFSKEVKEFIIAYKIDLISAENFHCSLTPVYSLLLNMVAASLNVPLLLQLHSYATTELQTELINQLIWSKINCVSKSIAGDCFRKGTEIERLETNYLGVDETEFFPDLTRKELVRNILGIPKRKKVILTATRIIDEHHNILREKGILKLIQAFSKLAPRYDDIQLVIAMGSPPEYLKKEFKEAQEMLRGYLKINNISDRTILKVFKLDEMPDVYRAADMMVLTSENETFGQVFIEAMACGIPVIGSNAGGIPEIITDSYNGYLVPEGDSLAKRIESYLTNDVTNTKFIVNGLLTVRRDFSMDKQFKKFFGLLESLIL